MTAILHSTLLPPATYSIVIPDAADDHLPRDLLNRSLEVGCIIITTGGGIICAVISVPTFVVLKSLNLTGFFGKAITNVTLIINIIELDCRLKLVPKVGPCLGGK